MSELPHDPFENTQLQVHLWTVEQDFSETGDDTVVIRFTAEGWGWLHTTDVSSDGTLGFLDLVTEKDPTPHDDSTT